MRRRGDKQVVGVSRGEGAASWLWISETPSRDVEDELAGQVCVPSMRADGTQVSGSRLGPWDGGVGEQGWGGSWRGGRSILEKGQGEGQQHLLSLQLLPMPSRVPLPWAGMSGLLSGVGLSLAQAGAEETFVGRREGMEGRDPGLWDQLTCFTY